MKLAKQDYHAWAVDYELENIKRSIIRLKVLIVFRIMEIGEQNPCNLDLDIIDDLEKQMFAAIKAMTNMC